MDAFFHKHQSLECLRPLFEKSGVTNDDFFSLTDSTDKEIPQFCSNAYSLEKGEECVLVDEMDVDVHEHKSDNSNLTLSNTSTSVNTPEIESEIIVEQCLELVENELYIFLNSFLEGQIVLGKYKYTKELDYGRLKEIIVMHKIKEDPIKYKISKEYFNRIRELAIELFPIEDVDLLYTPRIVKNNEETPVKGCLYNHYKNIRTELLLARKLVKNKSKTVKVDEIKETDIGDIFLQCLTDPKRENYTSDEVIKQWQETFEERCTLLDKKEKNINVVSIPTYFNSFPCLDVQFSVIVLEIDFRKTIESLKSKSLIEKETEISCYNSMFSRKWPIIANTVVSIAKKSRNESLKNFFSENKDFCATDSHSSLLALFLLPLFIHR